MAIGKYLETCSWLQVQGCEFCCLLLLCEAGFPHPPNLLFAGIAAAAGLGSEFNAKFQGLTAGI
jgi:hypothetical protein